MKRTDLVLRVGEIPAAEELNTSGREISFYLMLEWNTWNWNTENGRDKRTVMSIRNMKSLYCFVLGDQMFWLGRRWSVELSRSGGCFRDEDVFSKKALLDELFQALSEGRVMDDPVSFAILVGAIFFCSEKYEIVPIGLEHLTYSWSLMVLNILLMESLNGVK